MGMALSQMVNPVLLVLIQTVIFAMETHLYVQTAMWGMDPRVILMGHAKLVLRNVSSAIIIQGVFYVLKDLVLKVENASFALPLPTAKNVIKESALNAYLDTGLVMMEQNVKNALIYLRIVDIAVRVLVSFANPDMDC